MESGPFQTVGGDKFAALGRVVARAGRSFVVTIDAAGFAGDYDVFEALNDQFGMPAYFGWSWDALFDCLADLSWLPAECYVVVVENAQRLRVDDCPAHRSLVEVLRRSAAAWSSPMANARGVTAEFRVLLVLGDGSSADQLTSDLAILGSASAT
jgi:RNAse (barnase) inhibitor barstar